MIVISESVLDAAQCLAQFEQRARLCGKAGAIVSFSGLVREQAGSGHVKRLRLQAYNPMTQTGIAQAVQTAQARWPLTDHCVRHRIGEMQAGDTIVFVATASAHRRAAFEAADYLMDYLKTEAVFWKQETTDTGAHWIEPRAQDYADAARWQEENR